MLLVVAVSIGRLFGGVDAVYVRLAAEGLVPLVGLLYFAALLTACATGVLIVGLGLYDIWSHGLSAADVASVLWEDHGARLLAVATASGV